LKLISSGGSACFVGSLNSQNSEQGIETLLFLLWRGVCWRLNSQNSEQGIETTAPSGKTPGGDGQSEQPEFRTGN